MFTSCNSIVYVYKKGRVLLLLFVHVGHMSDISLMLFKTFMIFDIIRVIRA